MDETDQPLHACFRAVLDRMEAPVLVLDAAADGGESTVCYANPALARRAGRPAPALEGLDPRTLDCGAPDLRADPVARQALREGLPAITRAAGIQGDAGGEPVYWDLEPVRDDRGSFARVVAVARPAGESESASPHEGAGALHRQVFDRHALPMLVIDPTSGALLDANPAAEAFYGHDHATLCGMRIDQINTLSPHEVRAEMARAHRRDIRSFFFQHRLACGETRAVEVYSTPVQWEGREVLHSIIHDISERDRLQVEVEQRLHYDALTGLPNRVLFRQRIDGVLERARRSGGRAIVLHLDLDRFRDINEVWGHEQGDEILRQAVAATEAALPSADVVARLAGDELGVALVELDAERSPSELAERLRSAFHRTPFRVGDRGVRLYASIGVACYPEDDGDAAGLMRHAEAALIEAKGAGGDCWARYDRALSGGASERVLLGGDLRGALERGELSLALQPIVDLRDGIPVGAEALARWHHPEHGWVPPDRFIPVAEATGQIGALGDWVLRTAAEYAVDQAAGSGWRVAVNVSALQVRGADIAATVAQVLADTGLPPAALEIELTESALVAQGDRLIEHLAAVRALGCGVAIDDFGTGYSSLQYLKRLPVDRIKIDRTFVSGIDHDADNHAIVATIVTLARQFGLGLTAEGIETAAEAAALVALGCHHGQGYYYAAPALIDAGARD